MKKITVIGGTGKLGRPVVRALVNAGFEVSAMVRNPQRAATLLPESVKLIPGDLKKLLEIEKALEDADFLYLNLSADKKAGSKGWQTEREGLANALAIAKKHHIQRVGYIASMVQHYQGMHNFEWWVFEMKNLAVDAVKESGIPYAIFYPSNFMETLAYDYLQGDKMLLAGNPQHPNWWVAAEDYGKQVAKAFSVLKDEESRDYVVQGLEPYTADEAVAVFIKNYPKKKLKASKTPLWGLKLAGKFSKEMSYAAHIIEAIMKYPEKFEAQPTWDELGKPSIRLAEFAKNI